MFFKKKEKINLENLQSIFTTQRQTLLQKGFGQMLAKDVFDNAWSQVEKNAQNITVSNFGTTPLLLVVNFNNVEEGIKSINGHTELDLTKIKNEKTLPLLYVLLDVEDGAKMVAKSPKEALKKFEKESRHALGINESIALLTHHPKLLKDHYVISAGSFYEKEGETLPLLWLLDEHGNPELHYAWFHIAHGSYGTPSYAVKIP